jgi:hypothetical protein
MTLTTLEVQRKRDLRSKSINKRYSERLPTGPALTHLRRLRLLETIAFTCLSRCLQISLGRIKVGFRRHLGRNIVPERFGLGCRLLAAGASGCGFFDVA